MAQEVRCNNPERVRFSSDTNHLPRMGQNELFWLKLSLIPGFGTAHYRAFRENYPELWSELFVLSRSDLRTLGFADNQINAILKPDMVKVSKVEAWLAASERHQLLYPMHPLYPRRLLQISAFPLVLFVNGDGGLLGESQLAMVGSRQPSLSGKRNARRLAMELAQAGWCITSGLALGIDATSHLAALDANGKTLAVIGCGPDVCYPKRNSQLASRIIEQGGAVVSEFLPGAAPKAEHFPRRNRIISGMALGTLVVEAAIKSGSLITARYALEQGREVFAIPGNIDNPLSEGAHFLLKQGAKLTTGISDIHEEFQNLNFIKGESTEKNLQKSCQQHLESDKLLDSVDFEVTALDAVLERSKLPINELMAKLLEYELRGLVASVPGGYIKLGGK